MTTSDDNQGHGEALDEVLQEEIKDLTLNQIQQVLEYIIRLKQQ